MNYVVTGLTLIFVNTVFCSNSFAGSAEDLFTPFISSTVLYDTNLRKLNKKVISPASIGKSGLSDRMTTLTAGFNINWEYSLQKVSISASKSKAKYQRFTELDYDSNNINAVWNWQLGSKFSGTIGTSTSESLASFADVRGLVQGNLRQRNSNFMSAQWSLNSRWGLGLSFNKNELDYEAESQKFGDEDSYSITPAVSYSTPKGNRISIRFNYQDGNYPNRAKVGGGYQNRELMLLTKWKSSQKTSFDLEIGYVDRYLDGISDKIYNGINTQLTYTWLPSNKTELRIVGWKKVEVRDDLTASINDNTGFTVAPKWNLTSKMVLDLTYRFEKRSPKDTAVPTSLANLKEDNENISLNLNYKPYRNLVINLKLVDDSRDSNKIDNNYESQIISLDARLSI